MKADFQQQMQMLQPQFRERYYEEQKKEWDAIVFTSTAITDIFHKHREFGLMYESPVSMGITPAYFMHLMTGKMDAFHVSDIVTLCQAFERRTPHQYISITGGDWKKLQGYSDFLACMEQITNEVNAIVEPIKDTLIRKMQSLQQLQAKAGGRKIELPS